MQIAILGRQPKISLAELESLFGPEKITPISDYAALIDTEEPLPQKRLGGTIKSAKLLTRLEKTDLAGAFLYLQKTIPEHLQYLPEGKLQLGVSVYGLPAQKDWLLRQMLSLKKIIKKTGRSVRIIENKTEALEAAAVLYNKLTGSLGWEFLLVRDGADVILAQTTGVQNIDDYSKRDFGRPMRDAKNGMLPPKLAQIMINLAAPAINPFAPEVLLDPFCGTGVVLQEAILMGIRGYGTDVEPRMIKYTKQNLAWLMENFKQFGGQVGATEGHYYKLEIGDAIKHAWLPAPDFVVCETYLGKPLISLPPKPELNEIVRWSDQIAEGFLKNIASQIQPGTHLCLALPAWHLGAGARHETREQSNSNLKPKTSNLFLHLPTLEKLSKLGYTRLDFKHAKADELIYHRENQIVARELTVLEKK